MPVTHSNKKDKPEESNDTTINNELRLQIDQLNKIIREQKKENEDQLTKQQEDNHQMKQNMFEMMKLVQSLVKEQKTIHDELKSNDKQPTVISDELDQSTSQKSTTNDGKEPITVKQEPVVPVYAPIVDAKKPDDFNGDGKIDVERWVRHVEVYQKLVKITEDTKVEQAMLYLKDQASDWAFSHEFNDFNHFKSLIINRFGLKDKSLLAATALDHAQQLGPIEGYTRWFQKQLFALSGKHKLDDAEQVRKFRQGLKPEIEQLIIGVEFNNVDEIIHRTAQIESNLKRIQSTKKQNTNSSTQQHHKSSFNNRNNSSNRSNNNNNKLYRTNSSKSEGQANNIQTIDNDDNTTQSDPDAEGMTKSDGDADQSWLQTMESFARKNRKSVKEIESLRKAGKCFKCGQGGHLAKECNPQPKN